MSKTKRILFAMDFPIENIKEILVLIENHRVLEVFPHIYSGVTCESPCIFAFSRALSCSEMLFLNEYAGSKYLYCILSQEAFQSVQSQQLLSRLHPDSTVLLPDFSPLETYELEKAHVSTVLMSRIEPEVFEDSDPSIAQSMGIALDEFILFLFGIAHFICECDVLELINAA